MAPVYLQWMRCALATAWLCCLALPNNAAASWLHEADNGKFYLTLPNGGNVARYYPMETKWDKLLISKLPSKDSNTITIDLRDKTFGIANGQTSVAHSRKWIPWGTAADCRNGAAYTTKASMSLQGTPFKFKDLPTQSEPKGWQPHGPGYTCSSDMKTCQGDCGGHCGWCGIVGSAALTPDDAFVTLLVDDRAAFQKGLPSYTSVKNSPGCAELGKDLLSADECSLAWADLTGSPKTKPEIGSWGNYPRGCFVGHPKDKFTKLFFNVNAKSGNKGSAEYKNICQLGFGGATTTTTLTSKPTTTVAPTTNTVIKSIQGKMTVLEQQLEDQIQASLTLTKALAARVDALEKENANLKKHVAVLTDPLPEAKTSSTTTTPKESPPFPVPSDLGDQPTIMADEFGNMHVQGEEVYIHGSLRSKTVDEVRRSLDDLAFKQSADINNVIYRIGQLEDRHEGL